jgi:hypothetical protein
VCHVSELEFAPLSCLDFHYENLSREIDVLSIERFESI